MQSIDDERQRLINEEATVDLIRAEPIAFIEDVLGLSPWKKQREIIEDVQNHPVVAVASCHGAGKSWISAVTVLWYLYCHTLSRVISTAPTFPQVKDILWQEIRQAYENSAVYLGGKLLDTRLELRANWFATGRATDDPDRFQGAHSSKGDVLVVVDEAAGVKPKIWVGVEGVLSSDASKMLAIGNPTAPVGEFHELFKSKDVIKHHISAFDTPNFTHFGITLEHMISGEWREMVTGPLPAPWLVSPRWVARRLDKWGVESTLFKSRVLGQFPTVSDDTLIRPEWVEAAVYRELDPGEPNYLAADIARTGESETVIGQRLGQVARIIKTTRQELTTQTTGRIVAALRETGAEEVRVDAVGLGAGVYDRLIELDHPAVEMQSGATCTDKEEKERFVNVRAAWYWHLRDLFESERIDIENDEELISQLCNIKFEYRSDGRIKIESKEDMRKRNIPSPDRADMLMLLMAELKKNPPVVFDTPKKAVRRRSERFGSWR
jgi:phage terminase large subunit